MTEIEAAVVATSTTTTITKTKTPMIERSLFGGAIVCNLPSRWLDVSDLRPVPDNQECWFSNTDVVDNGDGGNNTQQEQQEQQVQQQFLIEILERVDESNDEKMPLYFFTDLAEVCDGIILSFHNVVPINMNPTITESNMISTFCGGIGYQRLQTKHHNDDDDDNNNNSTTTIRVEICVVRLVLTDILISLTSPVHVVVPSEVDPVVVQNPIQEMSEIFTHIIQSFQIKDYNIFLDT